MMGYRNVYGYGYGYNMMPWVGFFCLMALVLIIIIAIVVYKITLGRRDNAKNYINNNAIEILKQRYAKGEIDEEEYRKIRDAIEK
ncbi:SHOCT domain-containing protein [Candidatus Clostridium radicumherbarum]|uniref:SHOCT domain-containing protein n=1 Tax=Candidatus Clostridium radicumherbarum TaxID=3381662 RepID=A0ABW8TQ86_9CLOT